MNTTISETAILFDKVTEENDTVDTIENQLTAGCYNIILIFLTVGMSGAYLLHRYVS